MKQMFTVKEISKDLGIAPITIYRDIKSKQIECIKIGSQYFLDKQAKDKIQKLHRRKIKLIREIE